MRLTESQIVQNVPRDAFVFLYGQRQLSFLLINDCTILYTNPQYVDVQREKLLDLIQLLANEFVKKKVILLSFCIRSNYVSSTFVLRKL